MLFLDEIEMWGKECNLSSKDHITHTLRYLEPRDREIWNPWANVTNDWPRFKAKVISMCPGSEERYTITELEILVEIQAAVPMVDLAQFGKYHR
jgi:hypothetical protein